MSDEGNVQINFEPYDSEVLEIERVLLWLNENIVGKRSNVDGTDRMIIDKFHEAGFVVSVKWFTSTELGTYIPEVTVEDRVEGEEFDHDRMVHEVTNDILDLGHGGVIKTKTKSGLIIPGHSH